MTFGLEVNKAGLSRETLLTTFPAGLQLEWEADVTFLCGNNGSRKSSLLWACGLVQHGPRADGIARIGVSGPGFDGADYVAFDSERDSPRSKSYVETSTDVALRFMSHGQSQWALMTAAITRKRGTPLVIVVDEPETALSIKNQRALAAEWREWLSDYGGQLAFVAATHSETLLRAFPEATVLDLDASPARITNIDDYLMEAIGP